MSFARQFVFLFGLGFAMNIGLAPAHAAQDEDFFLDEDPDEDEDDVEIERIDEEDGLDLDGDDSELDEMEGDVEIDMGMMPYDDEEEDEEAELPPGTDNAAIYRAALDQMVGMQADEEGMAWETYLQTYPNTVFRKQISERMDELGEAMFQGPRGASREVAVDKGKQELDFSAGMLLEPIDPRSRFRVGFEWGYPSWINLIANYEQQIDRDFSVHGGMAHRFTGWSLEGGARYALIKSTRTDFILTAIGDLHLNLAPVAPGIRPMLAVGKRFRFGGDTFMDVQAQGGADMMFFPGMFSPRYLTGLNVTVSPSETVKVFVETTTVVKDMGNWDDRTGSFRFNQIAFGIRFQGKGNSVVGTGAAVPYSANYWRYHYGAVMADYQYYM